MRDKEKRDAVDEGVKEAWDSYLAQHDVTVPDAIVRAVASAFGGWLDRHTVDIVERVAEIVADEAEGRMMLP